MSQPPQGPPPPGPGYPPPEGQPARPGPPGGWGQQQPQQPDWPPPPQQPGHWPQPTQVGGYAPPPTQVGGYVPPGSYAPPGGYGPPPTQVGGYAPPVQPHGAPGAPAWGPPGAPGWTGGPQGTGHPGGGSRGLLIAGIVGLAVLAVVATVLALTLNRGDDRATASAPSPVAAPSAPSAPSARPSLPPALPSPAPLPAPPAGADLAGFLATLPESFTDCDEAPPADDGDLLSAGCGPATDPPGPSAARFYRYPDVATLDQVFTEDVTSSGLTEFPGDEDCSTGLGYGGWNVDGVVGGMYGCAILDDGTVSIAWTDDEFLTEGIVVAPGTTQADVAELYEWWLQNSAYRG